MIVFLRVVAISVAWVIIQLTSGWIAHNLSSKQLVPMAPLFKIWSWERGGNFYQRIWKIKTWKDKLPEAGAFFAGGVAKNKLGRSDYQTIHSFYYETIRAEFSHWLPWIFTWTFFLWNSADIAVWMPPIGLFGNLPFILIQRYNRARIEILLEKYL
jgi:glycosyl-4,4'-diaponeurosporenoate acyltransferase